MRTVEVCVAVIRHRGRLLVRRRREDGPLDGAWEFPGGKRRSGERGAACAAREAREETGLTVVPGPEIHRVRWDYGDRRVLLRFFECAPATPPGPPPADARWVTPRALARLRVPAANRAFVSALAGSPRVSPPPGATPRRRRGPSTPRTSRRASGR